MPLFSQGTSVTIDSLEPCLISIDIPSPSVERTETTCMNSVSRLREYIPAMVTPNNVTLVCRWSDTDFDGLNDAKIARAAVDVVVTVPGGTTIEFDAYVENVSMSGSMGEQLEFTANLFPLTEFVVTVAS